MHQTQRYTIDRLRVFDDHVQPVLVIHNRPQTQYTHMYVILGVAHVESGRMSRALLHTRTGRQVQAGAQGGRCRRLTGWGYHMRDACAAGW